MTDPRDKYEDIDTEIEEDDEFPEDPDDFNVDLEDQLLEEGGF